MWLYVVLGAARTQLRRIEHIFCRCWKSPVSSKLFFEDPAVFSLVPRVSVATLSMVLVRVVYASRASSTESCLLAIPVQ